MYDDKILFLLYKATTLSRVATSDRFVNNCESEVQLVQPCNQFVARRTQEALCRKNQIKNERVDLCSIESSHRGWLTPFWLQVDEVHPQLVA
jgi:hypothetical protein